MDKQFEINVSDALTETPVRFRIGKRDFSIYPPTLGKTQILKKLYLELDINAGLLALNPLAETMRVCKEYPDIVCRIISYSTFADRKNLLNVEKVYQRAAFLKDNTSVEDLATILSVIFRVIKQKNLSSISALMPIGNRKHVLEKSREKVAALLLAERVSMGC